MLKEDGSVINLADLMVAGLSGSTFKARWTDSGIGGLSPDPENYDQFSLGVDGDDKIWWVLGAKNSKAWVEPDGDVAKLLGTNSSVNDPLTNRSILEDNVDTYTYSGTAPYGSAEADAVWTISRWPTSGTFDEQYAPANTAWDDRTTATYNLGAA
jgi:hypothetical protein